MSQHISDEMLQLYVVEPESLATDEKELIKTHLEACAFCREHLQLEQEMYSYIDSHLGSEPTEEDLSYARRLLRQGAGHMLSSAEQKLLGVGSVLASYRAFSGRAPSIISRATSYLVRYPVRSAAVGLSFAGLALLLSMVLRPATDPNPSYVEIQDETLTVFNRDGRELWTKRALGMPEGSTKAGFRLPNGERIRSDLILVSDINGDGHNEVLVAGHLSTTDFQAKSFAAETLYCFSSKGLLRWAKAYPENSFAKSFEYTRWGKWRIEQFVVIGKLKPRLFVYAYCTPYFPSKILEVAPDNGSVLQTYWHAGGVSFLSAHNIDNEGAMELILGGPNNGYGRAYLAVLDPDRLRGCGPAPGDFYPEGVPLGTEKFYLLFPRTEVSLEFGNAGYNATETITRATDNTFIVAVEENPSAPNENRATILYTLDSKMGVASVTWSDQFLHLYRRLLKEKKARQQLSAIYWENLKNSVEYWDGERFVKEPTMNRHYVAGKNLP